MPVVLDLSENLILIFFRKYYLNEYLHYLRLIYRYYKKSSIRDNPPRLINHLLNQRLKMRTVTLITFLALLFSYVLGDALVQHGGQDPLISPLDSTKVPGKSPVELCSLSPQDDLVDIKYIDLTPNPPLAGQNMTMEGLGVLKVRIDEGAYANYEVKYGFIKLLSGTADLCEKAAEVDLECPIEKGEVKVQKLVELPSQIPPVIPHPPSPILERG